MLAPYVMFPLILRQLEVCVSFEYYFAHYAAVKFTEHERCFTILTELSQVRKFFQ